MKTFDKVYKEVAKIPPGKVTTYGEIAKKIGIKNSRVVGFALHVNKNPLIVPCHRVVNVKGKLAPKFAFGGIYTQRKLLKNEGVKFDKEKVNLKSCFYKLL